MAEYVDVETAIGLPGLRVVLSPGLPAPWSECAKAVLHVKGLNYVKASQELFGANVALQRWSGQTTAPVFAWNDEPPRSTWIEQLYLAERLAPHPRLIPDDFDARTLMFGLANEILSQDGFIAQRRHIIVRDFTRPEIAEDVRETYAAVGRKYNYTPQIAEAAPGRAAEIMTRLAARLERQQANGSRYFIGDTLTALDLYWACAAVLIEPLPEPDCVMPDLYRAAYTNTDPVVQAAVSPTLMAHRDFIYRTYLELPIDF